MDTCAYGRLLSEPWRGGDWEGEALTGRANWKDSCSQASTCNAFDLRQRTRGSKRREVVFGCAISHPTLVLTIKDKARGSSVLSDLQLRYINYLPPNLHSQIQHMLSHIIAQVSPISNHGSLGYRTSSGFNFQRITICTRMEARISHREARSDCCSQ